MTIPIFISSVQTELAAERRAVKAFVEGDALLRRFFEVVLFEETVGIRAWRDWLTEKVVTALGLNERQSQVVAHINLHGRITNNEFQTAFATAKRTASLDLAELVAVGLLEKIGSTGKGVF